ncbi:uncharacterized protein LOC115219282 [Argonauta hians]
MADINDYMRIQHSWLSEQDVMDNTEFYLGPIGDPYKEKKDSLEKCADNRIIKVDKPNEDQCRFEMHCKPGFGIFEVCLCCNVAQFEVYDATEGYLFTKKGVPASSGLLFSVISFKKPRTSISIKCIGITSQFQMKGILIRLEEIVGPLKGYGHLNVSTLRDIISDLGPETSERARSILNNIETYQQSQQNQIADMSRTLKMANLNSSQFDMSKVVSAFGEMLQKKDTSSSSTDQSNPTSTFSALQNICSEVTQQRNQQSVKTDAVDVSKLVEDRVSKAETRILETVDDQLKRLEDRLGSKLDALLNTISASKADS